MRSDGPRVPLRGTAVGDESGLARFLAAIQVAVDKMPPRA